ncbi:MAG: glyceraldehyde 3-phosphate dehydrogenase NAD-binding domain-containing protein, partial [Actinomycetota bacterium]|nr:glyceraldehyde 3-phosphate dehydrogenase NAD-binding domain-containing protein [Actinomycetota bacterium]
MTIPIAINGFGRMGRLLVRSLTHHPELELVHINEHSGGLAAAAHLTQFDSVHGRWE